MLKRSAVLVCAVVAGVALVPSLGAQVVPSDTSVHPPMVVEPALPEALIPERPATPSIAEWEDARIFGEAARLAWRYADQQYQPTTGLINSVISYPYATIWDIGSGLAAMYCANRLGLLPDADYNTRMRRALQTLQTIPLYNQAVFNKNYSTRTARMAGRDDRDTVGASTGYGWSAVDIGRLLVWLKIIATNHPQFDEQARRIVTRIDFRRLVGSGYLWGETVSQRGQRSRYREGRIPYEQYAAAAYALWGHPPEKAMVLGENALPIEVMGVPLVADRRGNDHLTSEPLVLMGLEMGWTPELADLAANLLRAQQARYDSTGQVTMVSEDAIPLAPHYFYYYNVNYHGSQFVVTAQGTGGLRIPRWVSTKAAYGWHALSRSTYTRIAVETVSRAGNPRRGWSSGVYEGTGEPTGSENINTAAVVLEAAYYQASGRPLIQFSP